LLQVYIHTFNGVIALFRLISPNSTALQDYYVTVVKDRPVVCRISSSTFCQNWPTVQCGLSAIAELLAIYARAITFLNS